MGKTLVEVVELWPVTVLEEEELAGVMIRDCGEGASGELLSPVRRIQT